MGDSKLPRILFASLVLGAAIYFPRPYSQLPATMASHFDAHGIPNGFMSKSIFFLFFPAIGLLVFVITMITPKLVAVLPPANLNLPNKEYWLAPGRRAETVRTLETYLAWLGCAILSLMFFAFYIAIQANLKPAEGFNSGSFLVALGAFTAFVIVWVVRMFAHFGRVPQSSSDSK